MQRPDRIDFPRVTSDELWEKVSEGTNSSSCSPLNTLNEAISKRGSVDALCTPMVMSPERLILASSSEIPNYFRYREENNLVTPARTPSDILRRGPLYESTPSEAETEPTTAHAYAGEREEFLLRQIDYHRERKISISQFVDQFIQRMQDLRDWHVHQESKYIEELTERRNRKPKDSYPTTVDYPNHIISLTK